MTIKLDLGDTRYIINVAKEMGFLRNELAYVLATAYHETWHTVKPIKETQKPNENSISDATVKSRLTNSWKKGQLSWVKSDYWTSGFFGRGYVQLTHETNYEKAQEKLGVDFVKQPSKVMGREYATLILLRGMKEGWFTGKKLSDFITLSKSDYFNARSIINGDKNKVDNGVKMGDRIAGYAREYDKLLLAEGYGVDKFDNIKKYGAEGGLVEFPSSGENKSEQLISDHLEPNHVCETHPLKSKRTWTWASVFAGAPIAAFAGLHWGAQLALVGGLMGLAIYAIVTIPSVKRAIERAFE